VTLPRLHEDVWGAATLRFQDADQVSGKLMIRIPC
jgi:hypothetical protein